MNDHEQKVGQGFVQKLTTKIVYIALALIAVCIGLFLYWSFQSEKVIEAKNEPFPVRTIRNVDGKANVVVLSVHYCKYYDTEGDLRISFLNTTHEEFLPIVRERSGRGCQRQEFPILVPDEIEPGQYRVKFYTVYNVNPLKQNIRNQFVSREFNIVE